MNLQKTLKEALCYAKKHLGLEKEDEVYFENLLLAKFDCFPPYEGSIDESAIEAMTLPDPIVSSLENCFLEKGMSQEEAQDASSYVLGLLSPTPSQVNERFLDLYDRSPELATSYLYKLGIANNYIAKSKVDKNICFSAAFPSSPSLEITINLSKPEKNNKDIAKLVSNPNEGKGKYPLCALCKENLGYPGLHGHAPRENIRFIPLHLDGEKWYLQFSPYVYYPEHCIVFDEKHERMEISRRIFSKLFAFNELFPHYFIGSNSDLPIVGGSILNHEHFQGGLHKLPLLNCKAKKEIPCPNFPGCTLEVVDFYDTVLRIRGNEKKQILDLAEALTLSWRSYDDPSNDIICRDQDGLHSTVTPILDRQNGEYRFYLILRNNRCDEKYPDGIFHAHPEYFHIKKEGIGLIEAAGRFILPARLLRQGKAIEDGLKEGKANEKIIAENPDLAEFSPMMEALRHGESMQEYYGDVCRNILCNVAVYKPTTEGEKGLEKFLQSVKL